MRWKSELTGVLRVHMRRVEAEVDEEGDGDSELEPLHHVGLAVEWVVHVTSQNHSLPCAGRHKLGLLSDSVGTCENIRTLMSNHTHLGLYQPRTGTAVGSNDSSNSWK